MKKILLSVSILIAGSSFAQIYTQNFESVTVPALPAGWSVVTTATDGGFISSTDYTSTYFDFPAHTKYVGTNDDVCNCNKANEKLISDAISIPGTGTHVLNFEYILGQYYGETGEVGVSTDGGTNFTQLALLDPTNLSGAHVWTASSQSLAAYAGQTINLVWIYHDNADWGSGLMVDDVEIIALSPVDMEMTSLSIAPTVAAGNVSITGTVTNVGADNITSIDISWNDGTGPNTQTFPVNLNFGDTYNFVHGTQLNASVANSPYSIDVCVIATSDADNSNDCLTGNVGVVSTLVDKFVLIEEKTGTWCQYCPTGAAAMDNTGAVEPNMIGVAVHNADPMAVATYDSGSDNFPGFTGYPYAAADRINGDHAATIQTLFNGRENEVPPASISFTTSAELVSGTITVTPSVDMVTTLTGDYRLGVILVEDDVTGTGASWQQVNAYSGGATSVPHGAYNWQTLPNPTDVSAVFGGYDHVGRALGGNQINGAAGSLPGTLNDAQSYEYTYNFTVSPDWDVDNMHAVAFLINNSTGEVLNAGETIIDAFVGLTEQTFNFDTKLYPNPTSNVSSLTLTLNETSEVYLDVVDMLGRSVYELGTENLTAGKYGFNLDFSNEPSGVYFVKVKVNDAVKTIKVNVTK